MTPIGFKYVWLIWSSAFMLPWLTLYVLAPGVRRVMLRASVPTAAFGLTQPLFVPAYWNPPSLFDLAQRTGFDIESLSCVYEHLGWRHGRSAALGGGRIARTP